MLLSCELDNELDFFVCFMQETNKPNHKNSQKKIEIISYMITIIFLQYMNEVVKEILFIGISSHILHAN